MANARWFLKTNMILSRNSLWDPCQQSFYLLRTKLHITHISQHLPHPNQISICALIHTLSKNSAFQVFHFACVSGSLFSSSSLFRKGNDPWLILPSQACRYVVFSVEYISCLSTWPIALCLLAYLENAWSRTQHQLQEELPAILIYIWMSTRASIFTSPSSGISYRIPGRYVLCCVR